jgi:hypothetical protein
LTAVQAADRVDLVSVRKVALRDNSPADAVPCIRRAASPVVALPEQRALVLDNAPVSALVPALADLAPEWVVLPD